MRGKSESHRYAYITERDHASKSQSQEPVIAGKLLKRILLDDIQKNPKHLLKP